MLLRSGRSIFPLLHAQPPSFQLPPSPFGSQGSVASTPPKDLNLTIVATPPQRYCFLWFPSPTVSHALQILSGKFQKSVISCFKLHVALNVIKPPPLSCPGHESSLRPASSQCIHYLLVSLSVPSQLQMRAQAFAGLAAMHGFRYPRELSEHTHNYRVYRTLPTANLTERQHELGHMCDTESASHTCLLWVLILAQLVACDAATMPVKTWGLNTLWRRAVLVKGESEFALQEFTTPGYILIAGE